MQQKGAFTEKIMFDESKIKANALRQKYLFLENIIKNIPHYLFWKDINSIFLGCNDSFAKIAQLDSPDEIVGKTDYDLPWEKKESAAYIADDQEIMRTGNAKIEVEEKQTINGKEINILVSKVPIYENDGTIAGILGMYNNITERKKSEETLRIALHKAEAANHAKTNFLAKVSHELRTPLNGILGTGQILMNKYKDPQLLEHLKDIEFASTHLLNLVNDILDYSYLEEGKMVARAEPICLDSLVRAIVSASANRLTSDKVHLIEKIDSKLPPLVIGDTVRIKQILINLVNNAIKYTPKGTVTIAATCLHLTSRKVTARLSVEDSGIGIPQGMEEKIFESFFQVDSGLSVVQEGVGLGLAISQQIAKAMGSKIMVKSAPQQGSLFWIDLILEVLTLPQESAYHCYFENAPLARDNNIYDESFDLDILVVEDNLLNQKIICSMLSELGCQTAVASHGKIAIEKASHKAYQLILMDLSLPQMDGFEITRHIRQLPLHKNTPIIAVTAHAFESDLHRCFEASMTEVLIKPISIAELKRALSLTKLQLQCSSLKPSGSLAGPSPG